MAPSSPSSSTSGCNSSRHDFPEELMPKVGAAVEGTTAAAKQVAELAQRCQRDTA